MTVHLEGRFQLLIDVTIEKVMLRVGAVTRRARQNMKELQRDS